MYSFELAVWRGRLVYVDRFQRDGPVLQVFEITSGRTTTLARLDPDAFPSFPILQGDDFLWGGFTVSPDGQWILFGRRTVTDSDLMIIERRPERDEHDEHYLLGGFCQGSLRRSDFAVTGVLLAEIGLPPGADATAGPWKRLEPLWHPPSRCSFCRGFSE